MFKKAACLVLMSLLLVLVVRASDVARSDRACVKGKRSVVKKVTVKKRKKMIITPDKPLFFPRPEPVCRGPLPECVGEPMKWVINNFDRWQGWSLTGYSHGWLTEDFNPCRVKFGMINGDLAWSRAYEQHTEAQWREFAEWEREHDRDLVLGVCITITF